MVLPLVSVVPLLLRAIQSPLVAPPTPHNSVTSPHFPIAILVLDLLFRTSSMSVR